LARNKCFGFSKINKAVSNLFPHSAFRIPNSSVGVLSLIPTSDFFSVFYSTIPITVCRRIRCTICWREANLTGVPLSFFVLYSCVSQYRYFQNNPDCIPCACHRTNGGQSKIVLRKNWSLPYLSLFSYCRLIRLDRFPAYIIRDLLISL